MTYEEAYYMSGLLKVTLAKEGVDKVVIDYFDTAQRALKDSMECDNCRYRKLYDGAWSVQDYIKEAIRKRLHDDE